MRCRLEMLFADVADVYRMTRRLPCLMRELIKQNNETRTCVELRGGMGWMPLLGTDGTLRVRSTRKRAVALSALRDARLTPRARWVDHQTIWHHRHPTTTHMETKVTLQHGTAPPTRMHCMGLVGLRSTNFVPERLLSIPEMHPVRRCSHDAVDSPRHVCIPQNRGVVGYTVADARLGPGSSIRRPDASDAHLQSGRQKGGAVSEHTHYLRAAAPWQGQEQASQTW